MEGGSGIVDVGVIVVGLGSVVLKRVRANTSVKKVKKKRSHRRWEAEAAPTLPFGFGLWKFEEGWRRMSFVLAVAVVVVVVFIGGVGCVVMENSGEDKG